MTACGTLPSRRLLLRPWHGSPWYVCRQKPVLLIRDRPRYTNRRTMKLSLGTPVADGPPLMDASIRFGVITMNDQVRDLFPRGWPKAVSRPPPERGRLTAILIGSTATQSY
jgi:hypothetical protein